MKVGWSKKSKQKDSSEEPETPPLVSPWTNGSALMTKAGIAGMWTCLVSGPLALMLLVFGIFGATEPAIIGTKSITAAEVSQGQSAGEFARGFITAWLRGTRGNEQEVAVYLGGTVPLGLKLPDAAPAISEVNLVSIDPHGPGQWTAVVGVTVGEKTGPLRRFYSVPIKGEEHSYVSASLPTPVAAPTVASAVASQYGAQVSATSTVWQSVAGFLSAVLAGQADVSRFTSPDVQIMAITPAPYSTVEIATVTANREIATSDTAPASGAKLKVMATVNGVTAGGSTTVQYALDLAGRDGRWEIAAIDPYPLAKPGSASDSSNPEGDTQ